MIGEKRDHIWMQVMRFGFGRSVSGSVFSEGRSLSKDDEKAYWGKIEYLNDQVGEAGEKSDTIMPDGTLGNSGTNNEDGGPKMIVKGSVLFGCGLEPMPIGLFVLTETNSAEEYDYEDDEDDDDDDDDGNNDFEDNPFFFDMDNSFQ